MTRWVALLRGVNVGGVTVRSADLAALFRELGFGAVKTVLATGNVAFDSEVESADVDGGEVYGSDDESGSRHAAAALKSTIQDALSERFGYDAWIVLLTRSALTAIAQAYPFPRQDETEHPYVVFGSDDAVLDTLLDAATAAIETGDGSVTEQIARGNGCLYWQLPRGHSTDSPVAKVIAKARYRTGTTTRNLRTVEKIAVA